MYVCKCMYVSADIMAESHQMILSVITNKLIKLKLKLCNERQLLLSIEFTKLAASFFYIIRQHYSET